MYLKMHVKKFYSLLSLHGLLSCYSGFRHWRANDQHTAGTVKGGRLTLKQAVQRRSVEQYDFTSAFHCKVSNIYFKRNQDWMAPESEVDLFYNLLRENSSVSFKSRLQKMSSHIFGARILSAIGKLAPLVSSLDELLKTRCFPKKHTALEQRWSPFCR